MKKAALALALMIVSMSPAMAQEAPTEKPMRFLLGAGLTFGGDRLMTVDNQDDIDTDIRAGGKFAFHAGVDYRVNSALSLQGTLGYQVAPSNFLNVFGDASFRRYPLEVLAYYHAGPTWRVGGGARYVSNYRLTSSGLFGKQDVSFDNSVGGVVEAEYLATRHLGLKLRYVHEKIEGKQVVGKIDGSHVGIFANYYF